MKRKLPLVSIVIPVYNGANYVSQAIDSALAQTYKNIEIVVVNDGSKDNTEEIVKSYGKKLRYFRKPNGGVATALNLAIKKARGEYISWLSHDDLYYPEKIEKQIEATARLGKDVIIYSDYEHVDSNLKFLSTVSLSQIAKQKNVILDNGVSLLLNGLIHGCTLLIRRSLFEEFNWFNPRYRTTQDYDLWFDMFRKYPIHYVKGVLVKSREHDSQGHKTLTQFAIDEQIMLWDKMINSLSVSEISQLTNESIEYFGVDDNEINREIRYLNRKCIRKILALSIQKPFTVADLSPIFCRLPQMQARSLLGNIKYYLGLIIEYISGFMSYIWLAFRMQRRGGANKKPAILIIEPNKYHGETIPSYINYWQKLGYGVDVICDSSLKNNNPFTRLRTINFKIYYTKTSLTLLKYFLKYTKFSRYQFLFLTTGITYYNGVAFVLYKNIDPDVLRKTIIIEHNTENVVSESTSELVKNAQVLTLWPRQISNTIKTRFVAPFFFGNIRIRKKKNVDKVKFLVIGTLHKDYKNYQLLERTLDQLLNLGIINFHVSFIGKIFDEIKLPERLSSYVTFLGNVEDEKMYKEIEKSDYLISLLDSTVKEHIDKYIKNLVTFSYYMSIGFKIPLIIDQVFADVYKLRSNTAIVYKNNSLIEGMIKAINKSNQSYNRIQRNLTSLSRTLYKSSLTNLSYAIKRNSDSIHI